MHWLYISISKVVRHQTATVDKGASSATVLPSDIRSLSLSRCLSQPQLKPSSQAEPTAPGPTQSPVQREQTSLLHQGRTEKVGWGKRLFCWQKFNLIYTLSGKHTNTLDDKRHFRYRCVKRVRLTVVSYLSFPDRFKPSLSVVFFLSYCQCSSQSDYDHLRAQLCLVLWNI